ncbi:MAG: Ig-like domain-containing protein [Saprospiraceae bacterium]|nr:Ig-like domain-containing protein [Saprospiraceae bacterium]
MKLNLPLYAVTCQPATTSAGTLNGFRKTLFATLFFLIVFVMQGWGQTTGDYRSRQSGNWNDGCTWERYNGTNWVVQCPFPEVAGTASSSKNATGGTTHTVSLPAGIQSGDLLLIFWSDANDSGTEPTTPSGWTQLYTSTNSNSIRRTWYKVADGTEGTTINITAGAERSAHNSYRIAAGTYQGVPVAGTVATGNSNAPDPPSLTSGFGATNTLWIASLHMHNDDGGGITNPTSYGSQETANTGGAGASHARMVTARRELNAASENPGTFGSVSATVQWAANTIAIQSVSVTGTPTSASGVITIRSPHTVTFNAAITVDQVVIESGATVTQTANMTIANGSGDDLVVDGTLNRTGGDLTIQSGANMVVNGTYSRNGGTVTTTGTLVFNSGGTYIHGLNGGTVPTASWNANSNCNITGMTTIYPSGMGQTFGNVAFVRSSNSDVTMGADLTCLGNLTHSNSGSGVLSMTTSGANRTIDVGGSFSMTSGNFTMVGNNGTATINTTGDFSISGGTLNMKINNGAAALNVTGDFTKTGGTFNQRTNATSTSIITVGGNFSHSSGTYDMSGAGAIGVLNVAGNFSHTGGTLTESSSGSGSINFNGSGTQTYTSGGTVSNTINFTVNSGAFLQMAAAGTTVTGGGLFTLSSGATLGITSPQGITTAACGTGGTCGNIRTTTRTFDTGANYVYNGTAAQNTGNGLPATVNNLTFDNTGGAVTLNSARNITNDFSITTGSIANLGAALTHTANTLTLGGAGTVNGSWGHPSSPATNTNNVFFANATGIVNVATNSNPCTDPDIPTLSATSNPICDGESTTLSIASGDLNDATDWQWYTVSCGGTSAGSGTSIIVSPSITTTYYVRGEGGCVTPGACAEITVTVIPNVTPTVSIVANPGSIICDGESVTFTATANNTGGGTVSYDFQVDNVSVQNGASNTYTTSALANGEAVTCEITVTGGTCLTTTTATSNTVTMTVNDLPATFNVTGGGAYCAGGAGVPVGLSGSETGVDYQLQIGGVDTGTPVAGDGNAISFGNQTAAGTYTIVATNTTTLCTATMTGNAVVTINPLPTTFNVTGGGAYCAGGAGVPVGLSGSETGVNYQLQIGGVDTGSPVAGDGNAISFGNQTAAGTYTVVATNTTTLCTATMTGNAVVTVNPLPTTFNVTGGGAYCAGGAGVPVGLSGSETGVDYQLQIGGVDTGSPVAGDGNAISFGNQTAAGTYTVVATNTTTLCTATMTGNAVVTINAAPTCDINGLDIVCANSEDNLYEAPTGMTSYQWSITAGNGTIDGPDDEETVLVDAGAAGTFELTLVITGANGCTSTCTKTVTVAPPPTLTLTVDAPANATCGDIVDITIEVSNNFTNISSLQFSVEWDEAKLMYQSYVAPEIGGTGGDPFVGDLDAVTNGELTFTWFDPDPNAEFDGVDLSDGTVILTLTMKVIGSTGSVAVSVTDNPEPREVVDANFCSNTVTSVDASIALSPITVTCPSNTTVCIDEASFGLTGGTPSGGTYTGPGVSANTFDPVAAGPGTHTITYSYTDAMGCSNSCTFEITVNPLPTTFNVTGGGAYCAGGAGVPVGLSGSETGVDYQLQIGGVDTGTPVAGDGNAISFGNQTAAGTYTVVATNTTTLCTATMTGNAVVTVNPLPTPTFTAEPGANTCLNTDVTYTTQSGQSNYVWNVPGTAGVDYNITSGGIGGTDHTVTLQWLTTGGKTVTVNYEDANGCSGASPASNTTTVDPNANAGTVSGTTPLCISGVTTYTTTGDAGGVWSSTNTSVATVDASTGEVTAVGAGTTDITYTISTGCGAPVSAFQTLTVNPNVNAGTVSGTTPLCISDVTTYTTTGDAGGVWSSTNTGVATVDASTGEVTAVGAGTTDITYTISTGCGAPVSAFQTLTVNPNVNAGTVSGTTPLCIGDVTTYSSTGDAGGVWSSTNTGVATVDASTGEVTAVGAGTTDITYTISTGCGAPVSALQTLTVEVPDINVTGNSVSITDGDLTPDVADDTNFGCVEVAGGTVTHTFTIENTTSCPLTLTGTPYIVISGVNAGDFAVTVQPAGPTVTNGNPLTFEVEFDPSAAGVRDATVIIASDDPDENPFTFSIRGYGVDLTASLDPNVNPICEGSSTTLTLTVGGSTGPFTYDWTPNTLSGAGPHIVSPVITTNYSVVVTDVNGCTVDAATSVTVIAQPAITNPGPQTACDSYTLPTITGSNLVAPKYYDDSQANGGQEIVGPITSSMTVWIYDETGTVPNCFDEESFTVTINLTPSITNPGPQTACDSYTLPTITGSNLVNPKYYDDSQANGGQEILGPITATTTVWIYDETGTVPNCFDEESFTVTINNTPSITNPGPQTACDSYTLPTITGSNLVAPKYYDDSQANGGQEIVGPITATTTVWIYDETGTVPNCFDEESFVVTINLTPSITNPGPQTACDSYTLPTITGSNLVNPKYYDDSQANGGQEILGPITATTTVWIYDETGTVPNCSDEESFVVTINLTPSITNPGPQTACDSYTLPTITGSNLVNPKYYDDSQANGGQEILGPITSSTTVWIYDETGTAPNCFDEESFTVTINNTPSITNPGPQTACDSYTLPTITGSNLVAPKYYDDSRERRSEIVAPSPVPRRCGYTTRQAPRRTAPTRRVSR